MIQLTDPKADSAYDIDTWRRRNHLRSEGFGPKFNEEDLERIGDNPEEAFTVRKLLLRDTEKALNWIQRALRDPKTNPTKPKLRRGRKRTEDPIEKLVIEQAKFVAAKFAKKMRFQRAAKWAFQNPELCAELCNHLFGEQMVARDWSDHAKVIENLVRRRDDSIPS